MITNIRFTGRFSRSVIFENVVAAGNGRIHIYVHVQAIEQPCVVHIIKHIMDDLLSISDLASSVNS